MVSNKIKIILICFSFIISFTIINKIQVDSNFKNFALGKGTKTKLAIDSEGNKIHIDILDSISFNDLKETWIRNSSKDVILFLGNSQTHSINNLQENQSNYVEIINQNSDKYQILAVSYPNASIQDFLITYDYLNNFFPIKQLFIPFFFDDTREKNGIKSNFYQEIISKNYKFKNEGILNSINKQFSEIIHNENVVSHEYLSTQKITNEYLEKKLSENPASLWLKKNDLQSWVYSKLYLLRNFIFNIKPTTIRNKIQSRYDENIESLNLLLKKIDQNQAELVGYIILRIIKSLLNKLKF